MKFTLYRPEEMSAEQWQIYAALRDARSIYDDPFFDPDFARLVGEVREDVRIGFVSDAQGVFAIWPLHVRPGNWARPIGAPFSDWNGPILSKDTRLSLSELLGGFDISGFTTQGLMPVHGAPVGDLDRAGAHLTDLSAGWDAFFADQQKLWPKHFKKMRRVYRKVEREFSASEFRWDDRTPETFTCLFALKQAQYARTGYHDVLKAPWVKGLFERLRAYEGPRMRLRMVSLYFDDQYAAGELNLQSDVVMHGWITAFEQAFGHYSPGNMLVQETLQKMSAEDLHIYDAGPGLDHYKRNYSNLQVPIDAGAIISSARAITPARMAGRAWSFGEQIMPGRTRALMARARRRMDQIAATEMTFSGRAGGVLNAISNRPVSSA
ncbi:MAG: GNAT family N-acetyltransferase [Pseudomonadota bacterium]